MNKKLITLNTHISNRQKTFPEASGSFSNMLWDLSVAIKIISREVNQAGLVDILGFTGEKNIHGEEVKKLDMFAHDTIYQCMKQNGHLCAMASEEADEILPIPKDHKKGDYVLLFDPLDGSSNIDVNVSIGTIFSILKKVSDKPEGCEQDFLQPGYKQIAAGYTIYGSSTMLVYTTGNGVNGFTLDPSIGEFILSHPNIKTPESGSIYSINEANYHQWDQPTKDYIDRLKQSKTMSDKPYSLRYIGSLVADFHRNLLKGGIFLYPPSYKDGKPVPKLRLLYEANPLAFIIEQAGGKASTGTQRILDIVPNDIHQKVSLIIGCAKDVTAYEKLCQNVPVKQAT
jgi:fructose-1,6-bisphosphatase I